MANYYWNQIRKQNINNNNAFSNIVLGSGNGSGGNGKCWQVKVMPEANEANLGMIVEYIGKSNLNYNNGYAYQCVEGISYEYETLLTKFYDGSSDIDHHNDVSNINLNKDIFPLALLNNDTITVGVKDLSGSYDININTTNDHMNYILSGSDYSISGLYNYLASNGITFDWNSGYGEVYFTILEFTVSAIEVPGIVWKKKNVQDLTIFIPNITVDFEGGSVPNPVVSIDLNEFGLKNDDILITALPDLINETTYVNIANWNKNGACISNISYNSISNAFEITFGAAYYSSMGDKNKVILVFNRVK